MGMLKQLWQDVQADDRWSPDNDISKLDGYNLLSKKCRQLCGGWDWPFMERRANISIYPDEALVSVSYTNGAYDPSMAQTAAVYATKNYVGGYLYDDNKVRYEILRTRNALSVTFFEIGVPYAGLTNAASLGSYVRFRRYILPSDVLRIYDFKLIDDLTNTLSTPLDLITNSMEAQYPIQESMASVGPPTGYLLEPNVPMDQPIDQPLAVIAAGGTLTIGSTYRYVYTWYYAGRESTPSLVTSDVVASAGFQTANLSAIEAAPLNSGKRKRIYREDNKNGVYAFLVEIGDTNTTYADTGAVVPDRSRRCPIEPANRYVRFVPYPSQNMTIQLRYSARHPSLLADTDTPLIPLTFHDVLVKQVVAEILGRPGQRTSPQDLQNAKDEADRVEARMRAAIFGDSSREMRAGWSAGGGDRRPYANCGTPTGTVP